MSNKVCCASEPAVSVALSTVSQDGWPLFNLQESHKLNLERLPSQHEVLWLVM